MFGHLPATLIFRLLAPLASVIDIPRPLRYVSDCPKIAFKIPIPRIAPSLDGHRVSLGSYPAHQRPAQSDRGHIQIVGTARRNTRGLGLGGEPLAGRVPETRRERGVVPWDHNLPPYGFLLYLCIGGKNLIHVENRKQFTIEAVNSGAKLF